MVYKIRRKKDGKFWKPRRAKWNKESGVDFDDKGKEFVSLGAAKNSFTQHDSWKPKLDYSHINSDYEIIEYRSKLIKIKVHKLKSC